MNKLKLAIRRAKAIPATTNDKDKCKAVRSWVKAVKEMLA
jgi:hypothetical protein